MYQTILSAITGFGILQSLLFAIFLFQRGQSIANRLLAFLLLAITIRITKSFIRYYLGYESHLYGVGFIAFVVITPLLYFYCRAFLQKDFKWKPQEWWHLVGAVLLYSTCWYIPNFGWQVWDPVYAFIVFIEFTYLVGAAIYLKKQFQKTAKEDLPKFKWLVSLLLCVFGVWFIYFLNGFFGIHAYIEGSIIYAGLLGVTIYTALKHFDWFIPTQPHQKYKNMILNKAAQINYQKKLLQALEVEKIYLNPNLKLAELATHIDLTPHRLSQFINQTYEQNFSDFINTYRLQEAQHLLIHTDDKILAIALQSGFNSLSVFNTAFKKATGKTPSQYRRAHSSQLIMSDL